MENVFPPLQKGGIEGGSALLAPSVAEEFARGGTSAFAFVERHLAINDDSLVPLGPLNPTPLAAREVVGDLADPVRFDAQPVQVVYDHVGRCAFTQYAAVAKACGLGRQS